LKRLIILLSVIFLFGVLFPSGAFSGYFSYEMMDACFKSYVSSGNIIYFQLVKSEWYNFSESMCKDCNFYGDYFLYLKYFDSARHDQGLPACYGDHYDWHHVLADPTPPPDDPGCNHDSHAWYKKTDTGTMALLTAIPPGCPDCSSTSPISTTSSWIRT
jgi:hypothetical protein